MERKLFQQHLQVDFTFPVVFTRDVFAADNTTLADLLGEPGDQPIPRGLWVVDQGLVTADPGMISAMEAAIQRLEDRIEVIGPIRVLEGGETAKAGWARLQALTEWMIDARLCRHSYVFAVGGGAMLDAVGLASSLVHRGLRLIRLPTTVLAQNDAGVGVKTAINLPGGKNIIGTFTPPYAVINDSSFLVHLSDTAWRDGLAEAFKVAMIKDAGFFAELVADISELSRRARPAMERLVYRCAMLHLDHIRKGGDPFEMGSARPLDFGHWSAHHLERLSSYHLSHGHAVAIGLRIDSIYAMKMGWLSPSENDAVQTALDACGFPRWCDACSLRNERGDRAVLDGLEAFREHLGGRLTLIYPDGLGKSQEVFEVSLTVLNDVLDELEAAS